MNPQRPLPISESILPYLDGFRKILHVPSSQAAIDRMPARGTTMKACEDIGIGLDTAGATDTELAYTFSHATALPHRDLVALTFVKDFDRTEAVATYYETEESYYWPAVLQSITFGHVEFDGVLWSSGGSPNENSRWSIVEKIKSKYTGMTQVQVDEYLSRIPWPQAEISTNSLQPTVVRWDLLNKSGQTPECLHGSVTVPEVKLSSNSYVICAQRTFDATPQTAWADHVFSDRVVFLPESGLWLRRKKTAITPTQSPGES